MSKARKLAMNERGSWAWLAAICSAGSAKAGTYKHDCDESEDKDNLWHLSVSHVDSHPN